MSKTVVFKQSYKSANAVKTTRVLNIKHLEYIATRPGTIFNKGCGFGLFGKLAYMSETENLNSLQHAKQVVGEVSKRRTIYRGVLSIDHDTATQKGYYSRDKWQELVKNNVGVIAKEMGIEQQDFCYMASMHFKKGHPHTHLLYWDNSSKVRQEFIHKEAFEIMAEKVRAEFGKDVWGVEITAELAVRDEKLSLARQEALSLVRELNTPEIVDVVRIKKEDISKTKVELDGVLNMLTSDKNRRYAYLKPETKAVLDSFTDKLFTLPQYSRLKKEYLRAVRHIGEYYGNDVRTKAYNKEKATGAWHKEVGNELLKYIKSENLLEEYEWKVSPKRQEIVTEINMLVKRNKDTLSVYDTLLNAFPKERTPLAVVADEEYNKNMHTLVLQILKSPQIQRQVKKYVKAQAFMEMPKEDYKLPDKKWAKEKEIYGETYGVVRDSIQEALYADNGYIKQWEQEKTQQMLIEIFSEVGRSKNYLNSKNRDREMSGELSKEAKKDLRARLKQAGQEMEM